MNFKDNPEEAAFRAEVREFVKKEISPDVKQGGEGEAGLYGRPAQERLRTVREKLAKRGWIAPAWPKEYGGASMSVMQQFIMNEEFAENRVPPVGGMGKRASCMRATDSWATVRVGSVRAGATRSS